MLFMPSNLFNDAIKKFEELAQTDVGTVKLRALVKAMFAAWFQGDLPHLEKLVNEAESYDRPDRLEKARVLHFKGGILNMKGMFRPGLQLCEESLRIFEEEYALAEAAWRLFVVGEVRSLLGDMEESIAMALRSIELYKELGDYRSLMEAYSETGIVFQNCALRDEAKAMYEKVLEIERATKMGNYVMLAKASMHLSLIEESKQDFHAAVSKDLEALEYSEKSGSFLMIGAIYSNLLRNYSMLGEMVKAEEYFKKLMSLPPMVRDNTSTGYFAGVATAVFLAAKNQWEESFKNFLQIIESCKPLSPVMQIFPAACYAWALNRQGQVSEAEATMQAGYEIISRQEEKFKHTNVQATLLIPIKVTVGQTFEARLDIVNISKAHAMLNRVDQMLQTQFKVISCPPKCEVNGTIVELNATKLEPFTVRPLTFSLQATKAGTFNFTPQVAYLDESGQPKTCSSRTITVTVSPAPGQEKVAGKVLIGYPDLDHFLMGGIPENYAVVLAAPLRTRKKCLSVSF